MNQRFLITGLPRSRTAWFSVVCGAKHEPISQLGYRKFKPLWKDETGVSDSGASLYLKEIIADFAPKILIVQRDMGEVLTSFYRYASGLQIDKAAVVKRLWSMRRYLSNVESDLIKRVGFHELEDFDVLKSCVEWLGVDVPNLDEMMHFRIESDRAYNLKLLQKVGG